MKYEKYQQASTLQVEIEATKRRISRLQSLEEQKEPSIKITFKSGPRSLIAEMYVNSAESIKALVKSELKDANEKLKALEEEFEKL